MVRIPALVTSKNKKPAKGASVIQDVLAASCPRPGVSDPVGEKNKYAGRFAEHMAGRMALDLSRRLVGITATALRTAGSVRGHKQLDVNFSTPQAGLGLGISLKSVHLREVKKGKGRYTHNVKRNEEELRIEAIGYHKRQPYAVMVGVLFLPFDSCEDGRKNNPSSFGSWVRHLRPYAGREAPDNEIDRLERVYIGLYDPDGSDLRFFDIEGDPPKNRRPPDDGDLRASDGRLRRLLSYAEFLDEIYRLYLHRNSAAFRWSDGPEEPLTIGVTEGVETEEGDEDDS